MNKRQARNVVTAGFLAILVAASGCGGGGKAPKTGTAAVDSSAGTMTQNVEDGNVCNLGIGGIGGITNAQKKWDALEACTPKADEQDKYNRMVLKTGKKLGK